MHHRERTHLEEWAALLGDDLADEVRDDDADRWFAEDEAS